MTAYIIVRCGALYGKDEGVFTGHINIVEAPNDMATGVPWMMQDGQMSDHLEHAFLFRDLFQATLCADRLMRRWLSAEKRYDTRTWFVREDGDFALGEDRHRGDRRYITLDIQSAVGRAA